MAADMAVDMAVEPRGVVALASTLQVMPGAYAVLIGSGASRPSGVMTPWQIAVDLVRRVALAERRSKPANPLGWYAMPVKPLAWYAENHSEDGDFSQVVELLAPSSAGRRALMSRYFEPTDYERTRDLKAPTRAHRALAKLVAAGAIRLIITTNFDRLIERALEDAGVAPLVVASADDARSVPPLHSVRCLVVKVNGDWMSPNLTNILAEELATYEEPLIELLSRILTDYGLIVCGWSARQDRELRTLLVKQQSAFFLTFWAHCGDPAGAALDVIEARRAIPVAIEDADAFFSDLTAKVTALSDLQRGARGSEIAVAELKRYITDPVDRVRLRDLVMDEVERVTEDPSPELLPLDWQLDPPGYMIRIAAIEASMSTLLPLLVNLAYYADEDRHDDLLVRAIERLAKRPIRRGGAGSLLRLRRYPALLALYSVGIAALANGRPRPFGRALAKISIEEDLSNAPIALASELASSNVLDEDMLRRMAGFERKKTPVSDFLHDRLRWCFAPLITDLWAYDNLFDDVEYIQGLGMMAATEQWAQVGRFSWRRGGYPARGARDGVVDRHGRDLVKSGMFSDMARLAKAHTMYEEFLDNIGRRPGR